MQVTKKTTLQNQLSEREYRNLKERLSYSSLKQYSQNRYKFFKENVLGEIVERESSAAIVTGDLVHVLLADQQGEFDIKFHLAQAQAPVGQMLDLVEALYHRSVRGIQDGIQTERFEVLFADAVDNVKYDINRKEIAFVGKPVEKILELFTTTDKKGCIAELYYKERMECIGKTVVSILQIQTAEKIVEMLKNHPYTSAILGMVSTDDVEVFNECMVLYDIDEIPYKSMVDKLVISHIDKTIQPWDYKTSWNTENGWEYSYLSNGYYIQAGLYAIALEKWKTEHDLQEYKVLPMTFIAIDTTGNVSPVLYKLSDKDVLLAQRGFYVRGTRYRGIWELHKDIQWNLTSTNWQTSQAIDQAQGVVEMQIKYR